jgi:hypothetical protein
MMDEENNYYICDCEDEYTDKDKRQARPFVRFIYYASNIVAGFLIFGIIGWSFIELYRE